MHRDPTIDRQKVNSRIPCTIQLLLYLFSFSTTRENLSFVRRVAYWITVLVLASSSYNTS
jgi:hypothetical protein